jgi:hypothetical protein
MKRLSTEEWCELLVALHRAGKPPFTGWRGQDRLLAFGLHLAATARRDTVALSAVRRAWGERTTRLYVSMFTKTTLMEMVRRPSRGRQTKSGMIPGRIALYALTAPDEEYEPESAAVAREIAATGDAGSMAAITTPLRGSDSASPQVSASTSSERLADLQARDLQEREIAATEHAQSVVPIHTDDTATAITATEIAS